MTSGARTSLEPNSTSIHCHLHNTTTITNGGSRRRRVSGPWYNFFPFFLFFYSTNFYLHYLDYETTSKCHHVPRSNITSPRHVQR